MESLTAVIRGHVRSSPDRVALIFVDDPERADGARRWSFAQLDAEARKIGRWRTRPGWISSLLMSGASTPE